MNNAEQLAAILETVVVEKVHSHTGNVCRLPFHVSEKDGTFFVTFSCTHIAVRSHKHSIEIMNEIRAKLPESWLRSKKTNFAQFWNMGRYHDSSACIKVVPKD